MDETVLDTESKTSTLTPDVILKCGGSTLTGIACIPNKNLVALSSRDNLVRIYEYSTKGTALAAHFERLGADNSAIHLCDGILASVDETGTLLTWRAETGIVIHKLKISKYECTTITKASESVILVGTTKGEIILVEHSNGNNLVVNKERRNNERINYIGTCKDTFVVLGDHNSHVWSVSKSRRLHTFENNRHRRAARAAVSDDLVVMCGDDDYRLDVLQLRVGYNLLKTINLKKFKQWSHNNAVRDISFINNDILMVTTRCSGIFFVSVKSETCISHCILKDSRWLELSIVLSDGRVCVFGRRGYCAIFKPPQETQDFIREHSRRLLSSDASPILAEDTSENFVIFELRKKLLVMEKRHKEQKTEIEKMKDLHNGKVNEIVNMRVLHKQQETAMEKLHNEQETEIENMKVQHKQQETAMEKRHKEQEAEIENMKVQHKQQEIAMEKRYKEQEAEIENMRVLHKEQETEIENMKVQQKEQKAAIENMKVLHKEQETVIENMKDLHKEQEPEIESTTALNKELKAEVEKMGLEKKEQKRLIDKMKVLNKEQEIRIASTELTNLKLNMKIVAQQETIDQLGSPSCKVRRIE